MTYFVAKKPTPIFNTPDLNFVFGGKTGSLPFDKFNLVRELEMIAFPGTLFEVVVSKSDMILEVKTECYPVYYPLFVDKRFGITIDQKPFLKKRVLPDREVILERLCRCVGLPYIWGGNVSAGIPEMSRYYPPPKGKKLSNLEKDSWEFHGLDCSGLLYEATDGVAPRNSAELLFWGQGICIEGKRFQEVSEELKPLDLVICRGHLFIVLNEKEVIESKLEVGYVAISQTVDRIKGFMEDEEKIPSDDPELAFQNSNRFLVRRFIF